MFRLFIKLVQLVLLLVVVAAVLNWQFIYKNVEYYFFGRMEKHVDSTQEPIFDPNVLIIDTLGLKAPVIYATEKNEEKFQELLTMGVVHYPQTAMPGQPGNVYLFGHSSDFPWAKGDYKTVFATLPNIAIGDKIIVSDQTGKGFIYVVKEKKVVSPSDLSVLQQDLLKKQLTLQTSYPIGTALKRLLVIAEIE